MLLDNPIHTTSLRIDSHQHFWVRNNGYYNWLTEDMGVIYKDFLPENLRPHLQQSGIDKTVLVQAAPSLMETKFMLSLAQTTEFIAGVVGWVDMQDPNAPFEIARLSRNSYFKGIRPMIQDIKDDDWMLKPELNNVFLTLSNLGLCFDALVKPKHLPALLTLTERYPALKVVIDHAAKPNIAEQQFEQWAKDIEACAAQPNVYCKLSGLVTEAGHNPNFDSLTLYMDHLLNCFGPHRLMWGSDWPVLNLATDYEQWVGITEAFLSPLTATQQAQIWSKSAIDFYNLSI